MEGNISTMIDLFDMIAGSLITFAKGFNGTIILIGGPVFLEIFKELVPVTNLVSFHVAHWAGKSI